MISALRRYNLSQRLSFLWLIVVNSWLEKFPNPISQSEIFECFIEKFLMMGIKLSIKNRKMPQRDNLKPSFFDGVVGTSWKIPCIFIFSFIAWVIFGVAFYLLVELIAASGVVANLFS